MRPFSLSGTLALTTSLLNAAGPCQAVDPGTPLAVRPLSLLDRSRPGVVAVDGPSARPDNAAVGCRNGSFSVAFLVHTSSAWRGLTTEAFELIDADHHGTIPAAGRGA